MTDCWKCLQLRVDTVAEEKGKLGGVCFLHITCKLKALSNLPHNISKTVENESTKILIMTLDAKGGGQLGS